MATKKTAKTTAASAAKTAPVAAVTEAEKKRVLKALGKGYRIYWQSAQHAYLKHEQGAPKFPSERVKVAVCEELFAEGRIAEVPAGKGGDHNWFELVGEVAPASAKVASVEKVKGGFKITAPNCDQCGEPYFGGEPACSCAAIAEARGPGPGVLGGKTQDVHNAGRVQVLAVIYDGGGEVYWPDENGSGWLTCGDAPAQPVSGELLRALLAEGLIAAAGADDKYGQPSPAAIATKTEGGQQRVAGFSLAQLARWMGREGFTEKEARAALTAKGVELQGNAVRSSLGAGRPTSPRYDASKIPAVPDALAAELRAFKAAAGAGA